MAIKTLPFDSTNAFQVIIDMPEGIKLERKDMVSNKIGRHIKENQYVNDYQTYNETTSL